MTDESADGGHAHSWASNSSGAPGAVATDQRAGLSGPSDHGSHAGRESLEARPHKALPPTPPVGHRHDANARAVEMHAGHEHLFRQRFWVCLLLSLPALLYSQPLQGWLGFSMPSFPGSKWVEPAFSAAVSFYGGLPFLTLARAELARRAPGMMTLVSLAVTVAFLYSIGALFAGGGYGFFWELVTLIDVILLGHWLETRSVRLASSALEELARLMPDTAERLIPGGGTEVVPIQNLRLGDVLLVRPGASIPADGEIVDGTSEVDEAMITGESQPVKKSPGDKVIAGTVNGDGSLRVRVVALGEQTALAGIMRLVRQAQETRSRTQVLADRAAGLLFFVALAAASSTFIGWSLAQGVGPGAIEHSVTVLVIACPHALGLAIPLVVAISTGLAARKGILVRDRLALEMACAVDAVIFDKTGTLTKGEQELVAMAARTGFEPEQALALAAAVEGDSEHYIARALRRAAQARHLLLPEVAGFEAIRGQGVRAQSDGEVVYVGGPALITALGLQLPRELAAFAEQAGELGQSVVFLVGGEQVVAAFAVEDAIRPESALAVAELRRLGVEVLMLTGDSEQVARRVAAELGIKLYFSGVLPEHKSEKVAGLQRAGKRVAMVGDGINDAPALARADVGIAIGSGTNVAIESAGIILVRNNPQDVVTVIKLGRAVYKKMMQNLFWATGYNLVALPLAAGALASRGVLLSPALGALFMSLSTIIVAVNAQLLRRAVP